MSNAKCLLAIPLLTIGLAACENENNGSPDLPTFFKAKDTIYVDYGQSVDVSSLFETSMPGTKLKVVLSEQFVYEESYGTGANDAEPVPIEIQSYSVDGTTITSAGNEIPEVKDDVHLRYRVVHWGEAKISIPDNPKAGVKKAVVKTINIPKPKPVISLPDGASATKNLTTDGGNVAFSASAFKINLDYNIDDIRVAIGNDGGGYITVSDAGVIMAGTTTGTGGWVYAYYKDDDPEAVKAAILAGDMTTYPCVREDINVYQADEVIGIVLTNGPETGMIKYGKNYCFRWDDTGQKPKGNFVSLKYGNGTYKTPASGLTLYIGESSQSKGSFDLLFTGSPVSDLPQWDGGELGMQSWYGANLKLNQPKFTFEDIGYKVAFTVTVKGHFLEPGWTVRVELPLLEEHTVEPVAP